MVARKEGSAKQGIGICSTRFFRQEWHCRWEKGVTTNTLPVVIDCCVLDVVTMGFEGKMINIP